MNRQLFNLLFVPLFIVACNYSEPSQPSQPSQPTVVEPTARFNFKTEQPLKVILTNTSYDAKSYYWDFGDGQTSTEESPIHKYSGKGVYTIILTAKNGTKTSKSSAAVTIEEPTRCYLAGYRISKIPKQNEYYQIRFTDQYTFSADNFGTTEWTLLSDAILPKTFSFSSPKQITGFTKYWCTLWQSSKSNGNNATNAFRCNITQDQLFTKFPETLTNTDQSKTIIEMHFTWK